MKKLFSFIACLVILQPAEKNAPSLQYPALVNQFYILNGNHTAWFGADTKQSLRQELITRLDSNYQYRMIAKAYHVKELKELMTAIPADSSSLANADRLFTDAAIALCKDVYEGYRMDPWVGYDQLTEKYAAGINSMLLQSLVTVQDATQLKQFITKLEPTHTAYTALKQAYRQQLDKKHADTADRLLHSLNMYRWIHHFNFDQFIVVNLPAARLQYFENDKPVLEMKTVVGKPATPTPRFATVCDEAILYPYWYVPRSITFKESLPKIKANRGWINANNMQVIDGSGRVIDPARLNWSSFHDGYFPYTLRQSTGCDNALGVIKFNIITPYGVYLHDTNNKTAFLAGARFFSHGCIRLEDPIDLGNRLLKEKLDTGFLMACFKKQQPIPVALKKPVPVFVVYMPAMADARGKITYYKDVYKLMQ